MGCYNDYLKEIGQKCADYRNILGISQQQVADAIGVDVKTVNRFEKGRHHSTKVLDWYIDHGVSVFN